ncbi:hypothetical protein STEG23_008041 [Scotinomys teguina]
MNSQFKKSGTVDLFNHGVELSRTYYSLQRSPRVLLSRYVNVAPADFYNLIRNAAFVAPAAKSKSQRILGNGVQFYLLTEESCLAPSNAESKNISGGRKERSGKHHI